MDRMTTEQRSRVMSRVRGRDTAPEMTVRRIAHALGLRFRLHRRDLPGTPDLVFPKSRTAVFVHGCFWHRHPGCSRASMPQTRIEFWRSKLAGNVVRDRAASAALKKAGWKVAVVWECEVKNPDKVGKRLLDAIKRARPRAPREGRREGGC
ncbi:very short patch repair endonuclease [Bradyrhizobium sp. CCBAU 53351]|uniref:very short patch repair endonuclease n=1 Tax=Bradyrhizobium sp. CCBAU 53351 TaxID=1325114 RepID=UPI00188775F8|nr:very short patch repair endonuclease [Bradyrhizobium sp. CCBAU 53351]